MASEWELITTGLAAYLTTCLQAAYAADCFAEDVTAGTHDFQELSAAFTPAIALWQGPRTQPDPDVPSYHRIMRLKAVIRRQDASAQVMQTEGNALERLIDTWLSDLNLLNGIGVSCWQGPGQTSDVFGGASECWVEYDFTIRYRQSL